jgi:hypothetical protein
MSGSAVVQDIQVLAIHGENQIEFFKIPRLDNARPQGRQVIAPSARRLPRARIRRLANVVTGSAR